VHARLDDNPVNSIDVIDLDPAVWRKAAVIGDIKLIPLSRDFLQENVVAGFADDRNPTAIDVRVRPDVNRHHLPLLELLGRHAGFRSATAVPPGLLILGPAADSRLHLRFLWEIRLMAGRENATAVRAE
jgi:hypothetical protein